MLNELYNSSFLINGFINHTSIFGTLLYKFSDTSVPIGEMLLTLLFVPLSSTLERKLVQDLNFNCDDEAIRIEPTISYFFVELITNLL